MAAAETSTALVTGGHGGHGLRFDGERPASTLIRPVERHMAP